MCLTSPAATWACGRTARDRLKTKTAMGTVRCVRDGFDRYLRTLAVCYAGDTNLNAWLVRDGWALSLRRGTFAAEEDEARRARRGIWAGAFIAPWHWRASDRDAEILGALKPSGSAAKVLLPQD
jgi:endonuclease YncB( thermonuclease family)